MPCQPSPPIFFLSNFWSQWSAIGDDVAKSIFWSGAVLPVQSQRLRKLGAFGGWVFPKIMGGPQIIHFNRVFHYKPSILGYPYFWKHPDIFLADVFFSQWCLMNNIGIYFTPFSKKKSLTWKGRFPLGNLGYLAGTIHVGWAFGVVHVGCTELRDHHRNQSFGLWRFSGATRNWGLVFKDDVLPWGWYILV